MYKGTLAPLGPISLIFMKFSANVLQNNTFSLQIQVVAHQFGSLTSLQLLLEDRFLVGLCLLFYLLCRLHATEPDPRVCSFR